MERIYYDISIDHDPSKVDGTYKYASKAETKIELEDPLLDDPSEYTLSIAKYKIDTETLPLMIPEMMQPQPTLTGKNEGAMRSTYWVRVCCLVPSSGTSDITSVSGTTINIQLDQHLKENNSIYYSDKIFLDFYPHHRDNITGLDTANTSTGGVKSKGHTLNTYLPSLQTIKNIRSGSTNKYILNKSEQCFVYSYQEFLNVLNKAILDGTDVCYSKVKYWESIHKDSQGAVDGLNLTNETIEEDPPILFGFENGHLLLYVWNKMVTSLDSQQCLKFQVDFSPNLYKYIGNGFNCVFCPREKDTKEIPFRICFYDREMLPHHNNYLGNTPYQDYGYGTKSDVLKDPTNKGMMVPTMPTRAQVDDNIPTGQIRNVHLANWMGGTSFATPNIEAYKIISSEYSVAANWNIVKGLLIGSDDMPVAEEYIPAVYDDGFLTHYDHEHYDYTQGLMDCYGLKRRNIREISKKCGRKILELYHPLSSSAGDIRSCVIYSGSDMTDGQKIDLIDNTPLKRFNIWVKWIDTYDNIYDLYLYPGCSVELRLCFTKRPPMRTELLELLNTIIEKLPGQSGEEEDKDVQEPYKKRKAQLNKLYSWHRK